jgi:hypothetical protein
MDFALATPGLIVFFLKNYMSACTSTPDRLDSSYAVTNPRHHELGLTTKSSLFAQV